MSGSERANSREATMRKALLGVALLVLPIAACKKTGENEYQVKTPDVNVSTDSHTVRTPDVDAGTKTAPISTPAAGAKKDTTVADNPAAATRQTEGKTPPGKGTRPRRTAARGFTG